MWFLNFPDGDKLWINLAWPYILSGSRHSSHVTQSKLHTKHRLTWAVATWRYEHYMCASLSPVAG